MVYKAGKHPVSGAVGGAQLSTSIDFGLGSLCPLLCVAKRDYHLRVCCRTCL